ncbi:MAG: alpha/beta hydrolase family protein [Fimbriimonadaceae bacterium]
MTVLDVTAFSDALGKQTSLRVLLPRKGVPGPYRTLYLLHGLSDDHTAWTRWTSIERYLEGLPLIVVMPDGGRGFYADAHRGFRYATAIGEELPAFVDATFPTDARRESRVVAGLSMGGYGAFHLALKFPQTFVAAASLSGALHFAHSDSWDTRYGADEWQRIAGPKSKGGPCDLFRQVLDVPSAERPALWFECGSEDFLIEANRAFRNHLSANAVPHHYDEHPGEHNWAFWDAHIVSAVAWLNRVMDGAEPADRREPTGPNRPPL